MTEESSEEEILEEDLETGTSSEKTILETSPGEGTEETVPSHMSQISTEDQVEAVIRSLRAQGQSWREIEALTGIPRSSLHRKYGHIAKDSEKNVDSRQGAAPSFRLSPPEQTFHLNGVAPQAPGAIILTPAAISNIRAGMSGAQQRIFDYQLRVCAEEMAQRQSHSNPGAGQDVPLVGFQQPLSQRELLTAAQFNQLMLQQQQMIQALNKGKEDNPRLVQEVVNILKDMALKSGGPNPFDVYLKGRTDERQNYAVQKGLSNEFDVQIRKAQLDFQREQLKQDGETKRWQAIASIASPLGPALSGIASQALSGGKQPNPNQLGDPSTTMLQCSSCGQIWGPVSTRQKGPVACPTCGTEVSKDTFARPDILEVPCQKCGITLSIPYSTLPPDQVEATVRCPKCGGLTLLKAESEAPTKEAPKQEEMRPRLRSRIKPTYT